MAATPPSCPRPPPPRPGPPRFPSLFALELPFPSPFLLRLALVLARGHASNQPFQLTTYAVSRSRPLLSFPESRRLSPSFFPPRSPSPALSSLAPLPAPALAQSLAYTIHRVYERTSLNKLLFIRPVAEMNLRDSYRTRPDMHDGFESLSFPPNVFSEVIDRWTSVPRNAPPRAVGSRGSRKTNAAGKRMPDRGCVLSASSGRGEPRSREIFTRRDQRRGKRNVVAAIKKEELGDRSIAESSGAERSRAESRARARAHTDAPPRQCSPRLCDSFTGLPC